MQYRMTHLFFEGPPEVFDEKSAPSWLLMDGAWFFLNHILSLKVGEHIDTDFRRIHRIS